MMTVEDMAPGCYGSALTYCEDAVECSTCPFAAKCAPKSAERLATLRATLGIVVKAPKPKKVKINFNHKAVNPGLTIPKKVQELLERFDRDNIDVTGSFALKQNPFSKSPMFMKIASHILLSRPLIQGLTRDDLVYAYTKKLNWTQGTAVAHANQAIQVLTVLGVTSFTDGRLNLKETP